MGKEDKYSERVSAVELVVGKGKGSEEEEDEEEEVNLAWLQHSVSSLLR